jgi:hypothetical protein
MEQHVILAKWVRELREATALIQMRQTSEGVARLNDLAAEIFLGQVFGLPDSYPVDED